MERIPVKSLLIALAMSCPASAFVVPPSSLSPSPPSPSPLPRRAGGGRPPPAAPSGAGLPMADGENQITTAPQLNGKVVLPLKAMTAGLKGHKVAAVYAILDSNYKRGSGEGWEHAQHVSITRDLANDISYFLAQKGPDKVASVRALSFSYPQKATMMDFSNGWKQKVLAAGGDPDIVGVNGWGVARTAEERAAFEAIVGTKGGAAPVDGGIEVADGSTVVVVGDDYEFDEDDEDMDEDDLDDYMAMMAESRSAVSAPAPSPLFVDNTGLTSGIVSLRDPNAAQSDLLQDKVVSSPFDPAAKEAAASSPFETAVENAIAAADSDPDGGPLELTVENVDRVLDEVRPYLISDGGNVSVPRVDPATGNVYLLLEGACGSCASSTVTMKMGIERVLIEKFGDALGEVLQVDPDEGEEAGAPRELTVEAVQEEVNRISGAIVAMGGVVRVVGVDVIGVAEIEYRGPNRVRKGLEMALLDVEFVKHVKFVS